MEADTPPQHVSLWKEAQRDERGGVGRTVIWLLLSVCRPFCLLAKPTGGGERSHSSSRAASLIGRSTSRLSWLPVSCSLPGFCLALVLRLTGTPRPRRLTHTHTRTDICGSTGYCEMWSHADASPRSPRQRFNELSAWITATQATEKSTSVLLCSLQVWSFICC